MAIDDTTGRIWKSFQAGDKEAFAFLYNLHLDALYHYGTKISQDEEVVKDAIQEIFLDLYLKKEKNKTNPENLKYYLMLALKRILIRKIKKDRERSGGNFNQEFLFEPEYSIETIIIGQEQEEEVNQRILGVLGQLPAKQKEAIYLRFNQSLEYDEVAKILDISIESARKQVYRAIKTIREVFGNNVFTFWLHCFLKK